jgi:signal transduction histidine kinase
MSLRAKIVLLVVGLTMALLVGLWLLLSRSWGDWAADAVDRDLVARSEALRAVIEVERDGSLELEDEHAPALSDPNHPFRIVGPGGFAVARGELDWGGLDAALAQPGQVLQTVAAADGTRWRVLSRTMPLTHDKREDRREPVLAAVQVAGPAEPYAALEERFRRGLLVAIAGALVVGGVAATVLVHLSLAPLRRLTRDIEGIGAASLERRISAEGLDPELHRLASAFNGLLGRLDAAMRKHREFVARASHALRTPISTILTRAEVALRRERTGAVYREALADVATTARDAAELVAHLLVLARVDEARDGPPLEPVLLAEVARDVERLAAPRAADAGVALEVDVPEDLVAVTGRMAARELLGALVENALRYTPRGGRAGIQGRRCGERCALHVWDTGPGIPVEERDRIFERFQRGSAAEASGAPGSGLGLSIVKGIADAYGAGIVLGDRPGGGLEVVVAFPTHDPLAAREGAVSATP